MIITVNGERISRDEALSIGDFLSLREISADTVVVELNREIIDTQDYDTRLLQDKDVLEILRFVGGG